MKHPWSSQRFREGARAQGRSEGLIAAAEAAADAIKRTHPDLPVIFTLGHLAHLAGVPIEALQVVAFRKEDPYRVFRVKKRGTPNGVAAPPRRYRTICVPHRDLMRAQRWIAQNILNAAPPHPVSFAFAPGRDLVGAARRHVEAKWLVKMDVRHFFESIPERRVYRVFRSLGYGALLSFQMARVCTRLAHHQISDVRLREGRGDSRLPYRRHRQGHLPQGAPTSPMLANLVMWSLDRRIEALAERRGWTYTRYADDLAFSRRTASNRGEAMHLAKTVEHELALFGLVNNREKTTIVPPGARKVLLGVLVDSELPADPTVPLFPTRDGARHLSRDAVEQLVRRHVSTAALVRPSLANKKVSPHTLRHSAAMSLLSNGVDPAVIALVLGHETIGTTSVYIHEDMEMKRRALDKVRPIDAQSHGFRPDDKLLAFLEGL